MNKKHIKVAYTSRLSGGSYTQVPKIQMEGRWLEELGFSIGNTIVVEYGEGSLCIRPMTETELAEKQRREAQKELDSKAAEIRSLQFRLEKENQDRISQIRSKMEEELQQELRQQSEDAKATMKRLEATYENRHEEYAQALFKNMIKE